MTDSPDEAPARELFQRFNEIDCEPTDGRVHYTARTDEKMAELLKSFAAVRLAERERCAEVAESDPYVGDHSPLDGIERLLMRRIAENIRASRGEKR